MMRALQRFLDPVLSFVRQDAPYAVLLLINLCFYAFSVITHDPVAITNEASPALEKFKEVEATYGDLSAQQILGILEKNPLLAKFAVVFNTLFLLFFVVGLLLGLWVLVRHFLCKPIVKRGYEPVIHWQAVDLVRFLILAFSFLVISSCWFDIAAYFFRVSPDTNWMMLLSATLLDLFAVAVIFQLAATRYGQSLESLGLTRKSIFKDAGIGILAYAWVVPLFIAIVLALGFVIKKFGWEPAPHELIDILVEEDKRDGWLVGYSLILACIVGPFCEEIFFRGFLYGVIKKYWGVGWGIALSSAFFAAVHESWFAVGPIFLLGAVLAWLREQRGSLTASIVMHMVHNTFLVGYFFILKRGILDQL